MSGFVPGFLLEGKLPGPMLRRFSIRHGLAVISDRPSMPVGPMVDCLELIPKMAGAGDNVWPVTC